MNKKKINLNCLLIVFAIGLSAGLLFYFMRTSFFTIHDDLWEYCQVVNGNAFSQSISSAKQQGRILFILFHVCCTTP